jgi:hypothetical protein
VCSCPSILEPLRPKNSHRAFTNMRLLSDKSGDSTKANPIAACRF